MGGCCEPVVARRAGPVGVRRAPAPLRSEFLFRVRSGFAVVMGGDG